jgi:16S rRNA (adenine1518-N6/adenine1519-N6)-dimethyltransferase
MTIPYDSPSGLKVFLEAEGLAMTKQYGQNFLVDKAAKEKLHAAMGMPDGSRIWEIGPGIGAMTAILLEHKHKVTAFEIDHGFSRILERQFGEDGNFALVRGDFIKTWKNREMPDAIFGNLPYNAALGIIADLLETGFIPPRLVFTIQKEAARRIAAGPGTKDYSAFSVLCTSVCKTKILYDIGASSFWPQPRVTSSVVLMVPRPDPIAADTRLEFSRFVRASFSSRRKTMRNNIQAWNPEFGTRLDDVLTSLGLKIGVRAEALTPQQLAAVHAALLVPPPANPL